MSAAIPTTHRGDGMQATAAPDVGQIAPDFKLKGPGGQFVTLSEFRGKKNVLLAFYPLAFSPVCSHQLPLIQSEIRRFQSLGAEVLGISVDSHYANEAFARHLAVNFPLLSDFDRATSAEYGVLIPDRHYSGRALFLIDREGRIAYRDISPTLGEIPSNERVLEALERLA
jgi:peroxiredoxin (alkyl hydroperoxide reductase subunit C)